MTDDEFPNGMTVGHWRVIGPREKGFKQKHYFYKCVSRCGVICPVRVSDLRIGRPLTCEGCREGYSPPPDARFMRYTGDWSLLMSIELINPLTLSQDALRREEWPAAKKLLERLLATTPLGVNFGWRAYIKSGHKHKRAMKDGARIVKEAPTESNVTIRTRAVGSPVHFDVVLRWTRIDVPASQVIPQLRTMCLATGSREEDDGPGEVVFDDKEEGALVATAAAPAHIPGLETRLEKVKSGIDHLLALNRDMGALAGLKAEAVTRERQTAQAVAGPRAEHERLSVRRDQVAEERDALARQAAELRQKLAKTEEALAKVRDDEEVVCADLTAAAVAYTPLKEAHEEAQAALRSVEANERERAAAMAKVPDLAALLAAFEKLS